MISLASHQTATLIQGLFDLTAEARVAGETVKEIAAQSKKSANGPFATQVGFREGVSRQADLVNRLRNVTTLDTHRLDCK